MTDRSMTPAEEMRFGCAPEETRPEGCTCRNVDEDGHDDPASEHDETDDGCPLNFMEECDE